MSHAPNTQPIPFRLYFPRVEVSHGNLCSEVLSEIYSSVKEPNADLLPLLCLGQSILELNDPQLDTFAMLMMVYLKATFQAHEHRLGCYLMLGPDDILHRRDKTLLTVLLALRGHGWSTYDGSQSPMPNFEGAFYTHYIMSLNRSELMEMLCRVQFGIGMYANADPHGIHGDYHNPPA